MEKKYNNLNNINNIYSHLIEKTALETKSYELLRAYRKLRVIVKPLFFLSWVLENQLISLTFS